MAHNGAVSHQSSITSLSWIPSQAVEDSQRLAFDAGMAPNDIPTEVAVVEVARLNREALHELSKDHRRTNPDRS